MISLNDFRNGRGDRAIHFNRMAIFLCCLTVLLVLPACSKRADLSGTWNGKLSLPQTGKNLPDVRFILTQTGREVRGTMLFTKIGARLPLSGSMTNGNLTLASPKQNGLAVSLTGTLDGRGQVKGEAVLDYDLPQLGKRQDRATFEMVR